MLLTNPRLAIFSHRWTKVVYVSVVIWGMVAPAVFRSRGNRNEHRRRLSWIGLMPASLLIGTFLAWPWLIAIFFGDWLHP